MTKIKLKAENGNYVTIQERNGQTGLYATGNAQNAIILEIETLGGYPECTQPKRSLFFNEGSSDYMTLHGVSVVLDASDKSPVLENRQFEVLWFGIGQIALKGNNDRFVSQSTDGDDQLKANRECVGSWEIFEAIEVAV